MSETTLSPSNIIDAFNSIDPVFLNSPQFELDALNNSLNTRIVLKVETLNPIMLIESIYNWAFSLEVVDGQTRPKVV